MDLLLKQKHIRNTMKQVITACEKSNSLYLSSNELSELFDNSDDANITYLSLSILSDEGYIKISENYSGENFNISRISLTPQGCNYFNHRFQKFMDKAITPILVSIVTTLILHALQWLLKLII